MLCHVFWSQVEYKIVCFIYDLNLIKEYFMKNLSDVNNVMVVKKDNLYMFLTTPRFKFWMLRIISLQVLATMAGVKQMDARCQN